MVHKGEVRLCVSCCMVRWSDQCNRCRLAPMTGVRCVDAIWRAMRSCIWTCSGLCAIVTGVRHHFARYPRHLGTSGCVIAVWLAAGVVRALRLVMWWMLANTLTRDGRLSIYPRCTISVQPLAVSFQYAYTSLTPSLCQGHRKGLIIFH